jgi:hypothetical protein
MNGDYLFLVVFPALAFPWLVLISGALLAVSIAGVQWATSGLRRLGIGEENDS